MERANFVRSHRSNIVILCVLLLGILVNLTIKVTSKNQQIVTGLLHSNTVTVTESPDPIVGEVAESSTRFVKVQDGDTLAKILLNEGIDPSDAHNISSEAAKVCSLSQLSVGTEVIIKLDDQDYQEETKLASLTINTLDNLVMVRRNLNNTYEAELIKKELDTKKIVVGGEIENSLFESAVNSGASPAAVMEMIKLFSYVVDFQRDLKKGDLFELYNERVVNKEGKRVSEGNILFSSLTIKGKKYNIYRYKTATGFEYFDDTGSSIKKAFLRTPINGAKVTSGFGSRIHPILGYSKMHKGVDFGAPQGTAIFAAGSGVIKEMGKKGNYGNCVMVKHAGGYETLYAHMSKFPRNLKTGSQVKQGEVIGYVGRTGRATGPHLHFELRLNGQHKNPAEVTSIKSFALTGNTLKQFRGFKDDISSFVRRNKNTVLVANNENH